MKEIQLTHGKIALVDNENFDYLNQWKWFFDGNYASRSKDRIRMHRIIIDAKDGQAVDHTNGNKLDNQNGNLRICTKSQNEANTSLRKNNKSGYKGVSWSKVSKKWQAHIWKDLKHIYLGLFETPEEAAQVYDKAAKEYHGEFAKTNGEL